MARASRYEDSRDDLLALVERGSRGKSPTVRDLADQCEVGVATMHSYLTRLSEEGLITWRPGKHRSLRVTEAGARAVSLRTARQGSQQLTSRAP